MLKKYIPIVVALAFSSFSNAELRPYINADFGFANTDFDSGAYYGIGGGLQFNENIEIEVAYNNYGDSGPFGLEVSSISYGVNLGGRVSDSMRLFAILGSETLEVDGTASVGPFRIDVDESGTEPFFGVGASFRQETENFELRTKLVSHDSADILTFNLGVVIYF
jgi:hypothetical protein